MTRATTRRGDGGHRAPHAGSIVVPAVLLASAFVPVVIVLAVVRDGVTSLATQGVVACCVACLVLTAVVLRSARSWAPRHVVTTKVRASDGETLRFTSSYVVPVVIAAFGGQRWESTAGAIAVVILLAVVYARGQLFYLNPTLALAGYRVYEVEEPSGAEVHVLCRARHLQQQGRLVLWHISDRVALAELDATEEAA